MDRGAMVVLGGSATVRVLVSLERDVCMPARVTSHLCRRGQGSLCSPLMSAPHVGAAEGSVVSVCVLCTWDPCSVSPLDEPADWKGAATSPAWEETPALRATGLGSSGRAGGTREPGLLGVVAAPGIPSQLPQSIL